MLLHLSWALHPLPVIRIRILSLHGPPVRPSVSIAVLVIHLLLLVAVLHVIHIPFMALGWGPIHAIHVSLVVLEKKKKREEDLSLLLHTQSNRSSGSSFKKLKAPRCGRIMLLPVRHTLLVRFDRGLSF